ncbi:zinc-binding dehydrogenase, partial [Pantoea septica]
AGRLLESGALRVVTDSIYPLSEAAAAHRRAAQGGIQGKIVLIVD